MRNTLEDKLRLNLSIATGLFLLAQMFLILCPETAYANDSIPIITIAFPSFEILLILVIAIEALVFEKLLKIDRKNAFKISFYANIVSTSVGFPLRWMIYSRSSFNLFMVFDAYYSRDSDGFEIGPVTLASSTIYKTILIYVVLFVISVIVEAGIVFLSLRKTHKGQIFKAVLKANSVTYSIILIIMVLMLILAPFEGREYSTGEFDYFQNWLYK